MMVGAVIALTVGVTRLLAAGNVDPAVNASAFKRFLVPVMVPHEAVPGAQGSRWITETWFLYSGDAPAQMAPAPFCFSFECPLVVPVSPAYPPLQIVPFPLHEPSLLVHVEAASASAMTFASRVRDLSRENDSAGTEIPVVPEERMVSSSLRLLNVPVRAKFRNMLRVYALPETLNPEVEIRYLRMQEFGNQPDPVPSKIDLLRSDRVALRRRGPTEIEERFGVSLYPSVAEIANFQSFPEIGMHGDVWIEVVPLTEGLRIWAFVSITNDETQQVTIVTP